jgi:signal transduction histidine kinase/CheY-like chemotaxis protein
MVSSFLPCRGGANPRKMRDRGAAVKHCQRHPATRPQVPVPPVPFGAEWTTRPQPDLASARMQQGKESPWSGTVLGVAALIALPFVLLAWLLVQTTMQHIERHHEMDRVVEAFAAGVAVIAPLETMRDLAPASVYLGDAEVGARFAAAQADADAALKAFLRILREFDNVVLQASADRIEESWQTLETADDISSTLFPFQNIERFNADVYAALGSMLFVSDMSAGQTVDANELLIQLVDTLKKARQELGIIRAIAVYTSLRDGFLSSADAESVDTAWANLDTLHAALRTQQASIYERLGNGSGTLTDLTPLQDYLLQSESELILASRVNLEWRNAWDDGERGMSALRLLGDNLVRDANTLVEEERRQQLLVDTLAALGLVLLYVLVTTLGVLFYRTRYAVLHAQAEGRAKGMFLARMSHEIRTPLNGVIGLAELLADTEPTPRQREYIELITSAGRSLISLVNDILDHAKIEAGKLEIESVAIDIRALVNESVQVFGLRAGQNRTLILCQADSDVPGYLLGDPIRIRQVLLNLVANAVKFTEQGRVEVCIEQATGNDGAQRLRIEVRDTGIGLTAGEQQNLFNLFTQASTEVTRRYGGTGLGLSISRELVQLMGGNIGVYSGVGPGSVFWFELPLHAVPGPARRQDNDGALSAPVLLVDGDGHLARAVATLPDRASSRVSIAANAADAQRVLDLHPEIAFVVINGTRDPADARDTAQQVKSFHARVRVRLLVAVGSDGSAVASGDGVVDDVVGRSVFAPSQLLQLLEAQRQGEPAPAPIQTSPVRAILPTGMRVLVAEDNPVNQLVTRGLLRRLGIEAEVVDDGHKAVQHYIGQKGQYDIVLMDLDMPVMDGNAATRAIRRSEAANQWPRCPVLALSAHAMPEYGAMAREAGMDGQLIKPVTLATLSEALQRHARPLQDAPK